LSVSGQDLRNAGDLLRFMQTVRRELKKDAAARSALSTLVADVRSSERDLLRALSRLYTWDDMSYLNYYGPPGTICTVSYETVLLGTASSRCRLRGSLVLVGGATGSVKRGDQQDTYRTAFDESTGVELTGVEIHATAVANLLTGSSLRAPGVATHVGLLALIGGVLGASGYYVRTRRRLRAGAVTARFQAAVVVLGLAGAYATVVVIAFETLYLVLPFVVPLAIQLPLALILGLVVRPHEHVEHVEAVCLATDAAGSTAIGQQLSHPRYARLMNEYNEALRAPVIARGGATLEPQGDGFVCLWCTPRKTIDAAMRQQACAAALEIADASRRFNQSQPEGEQLPTRVGLNVGTVTIYSDADRGVFKAFGDTVNVAARLRDLNVELGTHVLACDRAVEGLHGVFTVRPVPGTFVLRGVVRRTSVFEVNSGPVPPSEVS
jgi:adenylate cyclase